MCRLKRRDLGREELGKVIWRPVKGKVDHFILSKEDESRIGLLARASTLVIHQNLSVTVPILVGDWERYGSSRGES
jgi:hypothetical protein